MLLLSARAGEEAKIDGLAAGADDYLVKPFSARELLARVRANLDMAELRREALRIENELRREARRRRGTVRRVFSPASATASSRWTGTGGSRSSMPPRCECLGKRSASCSTRRSGGSGRRQLALR